MLRLGTVPAVVVFAVACASENPAADHSSIHASDSGTSDAATDAPDPAAGITAACAYVEGRDCEMAEQCSTAYFHMAGHDVASCTADLTKYCVDGALAEGSKRTPDEIRNCDPARWSDCRTFLRAQAGKFLGDVCLGKGSLPMGQSCLYGSQCQSGVCIGAEPDLCGQCGEPPTQDQPCQFNQLPCAPGLLCNGSACVVPHDVGYSCDEAHPCYADLGCESGVCRKPAGIGDACSCVHNQLVNCTEGCTCNPSTDKCVPFIKDQAKGAACGVLSDGTLAACKAPMVCQVPAVAGMNPPGVCVDPIPLGDPCSPDDTGVGYAYPSSNGCVGYARCFGTDRDHVACRAFDSAKLVCPKPGFPP